MKSLKYFLICFFFVQNILRMWNFAPTYYRQSTFQKDLKPRNNKRKIAIYEFVKAHPSPQ